eukprot:7333031-Ditylum_brightwellii.AAC.1
MKCNTCPQYDPKVQRSKECAWQLRLIGCFTLGTYPVPIDDTLKHWTLGRVCMNPCHHVDVASCVQHVPMVLDGSIVRMGVPAMQFPILRTSIEREA